MRKYILLLALILIAFLSQRVKTEDLGTKTPGDSIRLWMICYDTTTYPTLATPDSVVWYRYKNGVFLDSSNHLVPTAIKTGVIYRAYKAAIDTLGQFSVIGIAKKGGKLGAKTWTWKVGYDSTMVSGFRANVITTASINDAAITDAKVDDALKVDVNTWKAGAIPTPAVTGVPTAQTKYWGTTTTALTEPTVVTTGYPKIDPSFPDSTLLIMAKLLGAKGNRQKYFYNASGLMDSMVYYDGATILARTLYYRPTSTSAPDSTRTYSY
jgi:hypothetical protein